MAVLHWQGNTSTFTLPAAGLTWRLVLDGPQPGLLGGDGPSEARLLSLLHLSTVGRRDERAFDGSSLVSVEHRRDRVQATYSPSGWHGLVVRATWGPTPTLDGFDLEVQVSVTSPGVLRRLEVAIGSRWGVPTAGVPYDVAYRAEPRDRHAASLSYDGREPSGVLHAFTTLPIPATSPHILPPLLRDRSGAEAGRSYIEMVRPDDCARRIIGEVEAGDLPPGGTLAVRHELFGHDLEKGVVLRGRIRGIWLASASPGEEARIRHDAFLREPPDLGP